MPYTSFYDQQKQNFKNPIDTLKQGAGASSVPADNLQSQTTSSNVGNAPNLESLTQLVDQLNQNSQTAANAARIPNNPALEAQSSANIGSELAGQLPQDVITQMQQQAAERGVATGSPGSDNSNGAYLRALGLNSLALQQQGQQNLSAADARNPAAPIFDPTSQLLTPYQQGQLNYQNGLLGLDWYRALTGQGGGAGGGGRSSTGTMPSPTPNPTTNWWSGLMAGTPSSSSVTPPPSTTFPTDSTIYPGTSVPGLPDLGSILGPQDPGYQLSPDPYGQSPYGGDASNQSYWDFTGGSDLGGYDPFATLGG